MYSFTAGGKCMGNLMWLTWLGSQIPRCSDIWVWEILCTGIAWEAACIHTQECSKLRDRNRATSRAGQPKFSSRTRRLQGMVQRIIYSMYFTTLQGVLPTTYTKHSIHCSAYSFMQSQRCSRHPDTSNYCISYCFIRSGPLPIWMTRDKWHITEPGIRRYCQMPMWKLNPSSNQGKLSSEQVQRGQVACWPRDVQLYPVDCRLCSSILSMLFRLTKWNQLKDKWGLGQLVVQKHVPWGLTECIGQCSTRWYWVFRRTRCKLEIRTFVVMMR